METLETAELGLQRNHTLTGLLREAVWGRERRGWNVDSQQSLDTHAFIVNQLLSGGNYSVYLREFPLRVPFLLCIDAGIQKNMNLHQRRLPLTGKIGSCQALTNPTQHTTSPHPD